MIQALRNRSILSLKILLSCIGMTGYKKSSVHKLFLCCFQNDSTSRLYYIILSLMGMLVCGMINIILVGFS